MTSKMTRTEAQDALNAAKQMEASGWRRATPKKHVGAGVGALIGSMFAIYALPNPSAYIVFPILGLAIFIAATREKSGVQGRALPQEATQKKKNVFFGALALASLVALFFATIFIRRAYDLVWVPLLVGALVAIAVYVISQKERRAYIAKADKMGGA